MWVDVANVTFPGSHGSCLCRKYYLYAFKMCKSLVQKANLYSVCSVVYHPRIAKLCFVHHLNLWSEDEWHILCNWCLIKVRFEGYLYLKQNIMINDDVSTEGRYNLILWKRSMDTLSILYIIIQMILTLWYESVHRLTWVCWFWIMTQSVILNLHPKLHCFISCMLSDIFHIYLFFCNFLSYKCTERGIVVCCDCSASP